MYSKIGKDGHILKSFVFKWELLLVKKEEGYEKALVPAGNPDDRSSGLQLSVDLTTVCNLIRDP